MQHKYDHSILGDLEVRNIQLGLRGSFGNFQLGKVGYTSLFEYKFMFNFQTLSIFNQSNYMKVLS